MAPVLWGTPSHAQGEYGPEINLGGPFSDVAADGDFVHFVYGDNTIRYRRSIDNGVTWSSPVQIATGRIHLTDVLAADGDDVWVLYLSDTTNFTDGCCPRIGGNIYMKRSRDAGQTWEHGVQLTTSQRAFRISMVTSGSDVHIVWMDYRPGDTWDIYYLRSQDRGTTWDPEVRLIQGQTGPGNVGAQRPRIDAMGDSVHVAWMEKGVGTSAYTSTLDVFNAFTMRSLDGGTTWEQGVQLTPGDAHSLRSNVAILDTGTVVVSWDDDRPDGGQNGLNPFSRRSTDNGATWEPDVQISTVGGNHSTMKSNGQLLFHAWFTDDLQNIPLSISRDDGRTWGPTEFVNTPQSGNRYTPLIAPARDFLHVTWGDERTGPWRTWYRRRALETVDAAELISLDAAFGTIVSGGLAELQTSDDEVVVGQSQFGFLSSEPNVLDLRIGASTNSSDPSSINLTIEARLNNPNGNVRLRLRNWTNGSLETVDTYALGTTETRQTVKVTDAGRFVRPGDGRIEVSFRPVVVATFSVSGFRAKVDEVAMTIQ